MKQETLAYFTDTHLIILAMALFFVCFIGVFIWTNLKVNKKKYEYMATLPLGKGGEDEQRK